MSYKNFIEAVDTKDQGYSNRLFSVTYEDIPKPMDRLWLRDPYMGYYHKETIRLDKEDIEYLYNKYKYKAIQEAEQEKIDKEKRHQEEIKKAEAKLEELRNKKV